MGARKRSDPDASLPQQVMDDLQQTRFSGFGEELKQLYHFYLDDERRERLAKMGRLRRAALLLIWLVTSMLLKLTPGRRLLLVLSALVTLLGQTGGRVGAWSVEADLRPWGYVILFVILMLELKDKLLARDEIQIARQVQLALLPKEPLEIPGWSVWSVSRPANDVGGDLVDYIALDDFRHGIVVGDVAGKGLGAALLTAKLQATLRALVPDSPSLDDLGFRANTIFHRDGIDNRYATLFFALLEHDSDQLRYLNAGHNPPFVIRRTGSEKLPASSFPLGMLARPSYTEGQVALSPGDMLLAYSDGLTEATNDADQEFGLARLEAMLPELRELAPAAVGQRVLDEVDRFMGRARLHDDLSLVVMVRRG